MCRGYTPALTEFCEPESEAISPFAYGILDVKFAFALDV